MTSDLSRTSVELFAVAGDQLDQIDSVMAAAFDPRFGEAWNSAQILATLALPGYRLVGASLVGAEGPMAGFAISRHVLTESELLLLAVHPSCRRQGVALALLEDWLGNCVKLGVNRAFLEMREDNEARHLYQKCGFVDVALRKSYYHGRDGIKRNAVTMQKAL